MFQYSGFQVTYEHDDLYTDWTGVLGLNMQFRSNWGFETTIIAGESKDLGVKYTYYEGDLSSWFNLSPRWNANAWGGIARSYNFSRDYVGLYSWFGSYAEWKALDILELGTTYEMYIEGNPEGKVEDVTYNARPFVSLTPVNNLNLRLYGQPLCAVFRSDGTDYCRVLFSAAFFRKLDLPCTQRGTGKAGCLDCCKGRSDGGWRQRTAWV
jgi:hypothetical protein